MHEKNIHKFCIQVYGIEILVERWGQITKIFIDKIYSYIFIYGNISSQKTYFPDISEIQRIGCKSLKLMNANFLLSTSENYSFNLHTSIYRILWIDARRLLFNRSGFVDIVMSTDTPGGEQRGRSFLATRPFAPSSGSHSIALPENT